MSDYDFSRLDSRSFEHLIQSLTMKIWGHRARIYGDGRDGGREVTFDGKVPYPDEKSPWQGYGILQAKFRQRQGDTESDADWAVRQLEDELKKYDDPKRTLKKPEYYVFATNVVLSPVARTGGKDRIESVFERFQQKHGLKAWSIWDRDQLERYLDLYKEVRVTYLPYVTAGDVLARVIEQLELGVADFHDTIARYLQRELQEDRETVAIDADQTRPSLARVFVDLRASRRLEVKAPQDERPELPLSPGVLSGLLAVSHESFRPEGFERRSNANGQLLTPGRGKFVLVGGPGQGKTTMGQFLCQVLRANLLHGTSLVPKLQKIVDEVLQQSKDMALVLEGLRRFPVRIVLNTFASRLADPGSGVDSLADFICKEIQKRTSVEVKSQLLRQWLRAYPWLIVLDGLDEVPPSSNREKVLQAITQFEQDVLTLEADTMFVATTRPQGYQQEFDESFVHLYLAPLSVTRAVACAERLLAHRFPEKGDLYEELLARMGRALRSDVTAGLMQTPLQVSIMSTLVDSLGQPPQGRWKLFDEYHRIIFNREMRRDIPSSQVLRRYEEDIPRIHAMIGYWLQARSEQSGRSDAKISENMFCELVGKYFKERGFQDPDAIVREILHVSQDRLVLLVRHQDGHLGFELRSFQEFMAAQFVMEGEDSIVRERLREMAPYSHWRNTFKFAAGHCARHRRYLVDSILRLCTELNEQDAVSEISMAGSQLSLDLLEDHFGHTEPKLARMLARSALRLLEPPPRRSQNRLPLVYSHEVEEPFQEALGHMLERRRLTRTLGAWRVLLQCIEMRLSWADELAQRCWPTESHDQALLQKEVIQLFGSGTRSMNASWLEQRLHSDLLRLPLHLAAEVVNELSLVRPPVDSPSDSRPWGQLLQLLRGHTRELQCSTYWVLRLPVPLQGTGPLDEWSLLKAVRLFNESPGVEPLVVVLRLAAAEPRAASLFASRFAWWPLKECLEVLHQQDSGYSAEQLILKAQAGHFGDERVWLRAEERWEAGGWSLRDLDAMTLARFPLHAEIDRIGCPLSCMGTGTYWDQHHDAFYARFNDNFRLAKLIQAARNNCNYWCIDWEQMGMRYGGVQASALEAVVTEFKSLGSTDSRLLLEMVNTYPWPTVSLPQELDLLLFVCQTLETPPRIWNDEALSTFYRENPQHHDLLLLISPGTRGLPWQLLSLERFTSPRQKVAAIEHALLHPELPLDEVRALLAEAQGLETKAPGLLERIARGVVQREQPTGLREVLLLGLYRILESQGSSLLAEVAEALDKLLARRSSRLARPETLQRLGLPS